MQGWFFLTLFLVAVGCVTHARAELYNRRLDWALFALVLVALLGSTGVLCWHLATNTGAALRPYCRHESCVTCARGKLIPPGN
jgi:hypothetical protein